MQDEYQGTHVAVFILINPPSRINAEMGKIVVKFSHKGSLFIGIKTDKRPMTTKTAARIPECSSSLRLAMRATT